MKMSFIMMPYWTNSGRLRPSWARTSASTCGLGLRPAMARAGSTPGVLKKMKNTMTVMMNITSTAHSERRTTKVSTATTRALSSGAPSSGARSWRSLLHPQLCPRVERVPDPVAEHVQRQHGQDDHDARRERNPRPGIQQLLAVVDDRPPADIRWLHADGQERQRRLGQHVGGDHQRQQHDDRGD